MTQTYNFTAFTEADLLEGNDRNLNRGDSFTMPAEATTTFSVNDDDANLSGDHGSNDRSDDTSGQTAEIQVGGETVFADATIYMEKIHILRGSDGNTYTLVEIEIPGDGAPGTGDDFFTFSGAVPPAGTTLTVLRGRNAAEYSYADLGAGAAEAAPEYRVSDDPDALLIDFENLARGTVVDDEYEGVTISAQRTRRNDDLNDAMVFDTNNVSGGDTDLATQTQGNVLIVSEDNDSDDPDDAVGGVITFDFDTPANILDLKVVDTEEGGTIELFDADGNSIAVLQIPRIGDGELDQVLIDTDGVSSLVVTLNGSGAIDDLAYVPGPEEEKDPLIVFGFETRDDDKSEDTVYVSEFNVFASSADVDLIFTGDFNNVLQGPNLELSIITVIDEAGQIVEPAPDGLNVFNDINEDGIAQADEVLLQGQAVMFEFSPVDTGESDEFYFVFEITGGSLADEFSDFVSLRLDTGDTDFDGDFEQDFSGFAIGEIQNTEDPFLV